MKVIIMRGLPGAGKDWWIRKNYPNAVVCCADDAHTNDNGVYEFKPSMAKYAHGACYLKFEAQMAKPARLGPDWPSGVTIVNNANCSVWEFAPYYRMAEVHGADVEIVYLDCSVATAVGRNVHGVPRETIERMRDRLVASSGQFPSWWKQTTIEVFSEFDRSPRDSLATDFEIGDSD